MKNNNEAIYAAKPAHFVEGEIDPWRAGSIRLTENNGYLYAVELGNEWPSTAGYAKYKHSKPPRAPFAVPGGEPSEGPEIRMLGSDQPLPWHL